MSLTRRELITLPFKAGAVALAAKLGLKQTEIQTSLGRGSWMKLDNYGINARDVRMSIARQILTND
jgi:hypothetical protein